MNNFVDGNYQGRGVGRKLFDKMQANNTNSRITVHSSEYAADIYKKLGFVREGELREEAVLDIYPWCLSGK